MSFLVCIPSPLHILKQHLEKCVSYCCRVECAAVCGLILASTNISPAGRLVFFPPELLFLYEETKPPSLTFGSGLYARVFPPLF